MKEFNSQSDKKFFTSDEIDNIWFKLAIFEFIFFKTNQHQNTNEIDIVKINVFFFIEINESLESNSFYLDVTAVGPIDTVSSFLKLLVYI